MVVSNFIELLKNPTKVGQQNALELKKVIEKYPYFQSARSLHLKSLKKQESYKYNKELKVTAAYTTDRTILFHFICSEEHYPKNNSYSRENFSANKPKEIQKAEEELSIGKPLSFSHNEAHSFGQWLQLASQKPIIRIKENKEKNHKDLIIDEFIKNNPKISRVNKNAPVEPKTTESTKSTLPMTETLARVYLEQKKYNNAIKAYKILSLKYPEKSGFFADQIKRIQILQKNK
ncbi:hypothetical protein [Tenacibaculum maritimum]|uniref:hypothetical protein n=1 Tax=Tenacibaculum maritimum TaxID=107401 RepID=UPI0010A4385B|nr:hypothetical protein [Tenacibaculum maritimum]QCD61453.1 hypothetical protein B9C57_02330 [Tenacibaculum maritimum]CAA0167363.1 conserved hypothetical protein [Tenacibaculum maritimum]CAA0175811.1 conserved hypothetical protein [Tenacibaculum maritimum]CAA0257447.1 conserved hypothetical protein [Tenacibaculum maritimum]